MTAYDKGDQQATADPRSPCNSKIHCRSQSGLDGASSDSNNPEKIDGNTWVTT